MCFCISQHFFSSKVLETINIYLTTSDTAVPVKAKDFFNISGLNIFADFVPYFLLNGSNCTSFTELYFTITRFGPSLIFVYNKTASTGIMWQIQSPLLLRHDGNAKYWSVSQGDPCVPSQCHLSNCFRKQFSDTVFPYVQPAAYPHYRPPADPINYRLNNPAV